MVRSFAPLNATWIRSTDSSGRYTSQKLGSNPQQEDNVGKSSPDVRPGRERALGRGGGRRRGRNKRQHISSQDAHCYKQGALLL